MQLFWEAVVAQEDFQETLIKIVGDIVKGPAWSQSLKGVWTAGLRRSLKYVGAKMAKYFEGRKARAEEGRAGTMSSSDVGTTEEKEKDKEGEVDKKKPS